MATAGPLYPGTVVDAADVGTVVWSNPAYAKTSNNVYATYYASGPSLGTSHWLKTTGYGFAIPTNATIDGVEVGVEVKSSSSNGANENGVKLVKAGAVTGVDQGAGSTLDTLELVFTYGSPTNMWGTTLTPSEVNAAGFGAAYAAKVSQSGITVSVDAISVTVYYTLPVTNYAETAQSQTILTRVEQTSAAGFADAGASLAVLAVATGSDTLALPETNAAQAALVQAQAVERADYLDRAEQGIAAQAVESSRYDAFERPLQAVLALAQGVDWLGASSLRDNFEGTLARWVAGGIGSGTADIAAGRLRLSYFSDGLSYGSIQSVEPVRLVDGRVKVEVVSWPGTQYYEEMGLDAQAGVGNRVEWYISGTGISARTIVNGTDTSVSQGTYDPVAMRWLALREASGTTYWEYSADGLSWTTAYSLATPVDVSKVTIEVYAGQWQTSGAAGVALFDNVNCDVFVEADRAQATLVETAGFDLLQPFGGAVELAEQAVLALMQAGHRVDAVDGPQLAALARVAAADAQEMLELAQADVLALAASSDWQEMLEQAAQAVLALASLTVVAAFGETAQAGVLARALTVDWIGYVEAVGQTALTLAEAFDRQDVRALAAAVVLGQVEGVSAHAFVDVPDDIVMLIQTEAGDLVVAHPVARYLTTLLAARLYGATLAIWGYETTLRHTVPYSVTQAVDG